jgi:hypothetical protein
MLRIFVIVKVPSVLRYVDTVPSNLFPELFESTTTTLLPEIYAKSLPTSKGTLWSYNGEMDTELVVDVLNLSPETPVGPVTPVGPISPVGPVGPSIPSKFTLYVANELKSVKSVT